MKSKFTGNILEYIGVNLAVGVISGATLGIALPWMLCYQQKWVAKNTYVDGRQLAFTGTGIGLIGNWIKWLFLIFITCGIYGLWVGLKLQQWTAEHTHFADSIEE